MTTNDVTVPGKVEKEIIESYSGVVGVDFAGQSSEGGYWGHSLTESDGELSCQDCDKSFEVPDLIQQTNVRRQQIYKLYLYGKFKSVSCKPKIQAQHAGDRMKLYGEEFFYNGKNFVHGRTGRVMSQDEIVTWAKEDAMNHADSPYTMNGSASYSSKNDHTDHKFDSGYGLDTSHSSGTAHSDDFSTTHESGKSDDSESMVQSIIGRFK